MEINMPNIMTSEEIQGNKISATIAGGAAGLLFGTGLAACLGQPALVMGVGSVVCAAGGSCAANVYWKHRQLDSAVAPLIPPQQQVMGSTPPAA
jgi:uncharacterized membrane protein YebE (DUF533 family)